MVNFTYKSDPANLNQVKLEVSNPGNTKTHTYAWLVNGKPLDGTSPVFTPPTDDTTKEAIPGLYWVIVTQVVSGRQTDMGSGFITAPAPKEATAPTDPSNSAGQSHSSSTVVTLQRANNTALPDVALWVLIQRNARNLSFQKFDDHIKSVFSAPTAGYAAPKGGAGQTPFESLFAQRALPFTDSDFFRALKVATELFLLAQAENFAGVKFDADDVAEVNRRLNPREPLSADELGALRDTYLVDDPLDPINRPDVIPYFDLIRRQLERDSETSLPAAITQPVRKYFDYRRNQPFLIELLWSYWHEEGMLVQSLGVISQRFQNIRTADRDPLGNLEINPLRPLNNLIWGYIQDEQHRLTVRRRAYEYDHLYGISLQGKAVGELNSADSRSKFLTAFHNLLHLATVFFKQDDDTTVVADAFPLVNSLRDLHMVLSQGASNQFGDLPTTARQEMMIQQWLLARPEFRDFLPTKANVAYPEPWMDRVDAMKGLMGWSDTSVMHFSNLAQFGEQLLLSVRYGGWSVSGIGAVHAANWARFWRQEIQGYIYAYLTVTRVDLSASQVDTTASNDRNLPPSVHLIRQLEQQKRNLPSPVSSNLGSVRQNRLPRSGG
jgi:hypothetical protein